MITRRFVTWLVTLALVVTAAFTLRTVVATSAVVAVSQDRSDYFQRHQNAGIQPNTVSGLDDYWLRHPSAGLQPTSGSDLSDWYLRHASENRSAAQTASTVDMSDWYLRHAHDTGRQSVP